MLLYEKWKYKLTKNLDKLQKAYCMQINLEKGNVKGIKQTISN